MAQDLYDPNLPWQTVLKQAVTLYVRDCGSGLNLLHTTDTPRRVAESFAEYVSGAAEDPRKHLQTAFARGNYDEMIHVRRIRIISMCAHHLQPILGTAHFAYLPSGSIIGLSKIPRFIDVLCRRLQVQENLTREIVDIFQDELQPAGCAVNIQAYHCCMMIRGVREHEAVTETTAFRGCFKTQDVTRAEFLSAVNHNETVFP